MKQEFRNIAFISYNHRDMAVAKQLHRKLDAWRLPSNLHKAHPELPIRLREIFRDTEGLGAGGDLSEQIKAKLRESKFLIVICSPNSAQSKWVNDEVTYFKELGREKQIIPFIIAGKPYVETEEECFTPSLRKLKNEGIDPASANVNENGFDHACVKVISGMLGLDFDTLWQRHRRAEKRKRRRNIILAIFVAVIGIGLAILFANQKAEIQENLNGMLEMQSRVVVEKAKVKKDPVKSLAMLLDVLPRNYQNPDCPYTFEAGSALVEFLDTTRLDRVFWHEGEVNSVAFNSDGTKIVTASDDKVRIWDTTTGKELLRLEHEYDVNSAAFSPDGTRIVSASWDRTARLWDAVIGKELLRMERHGYNVNSVAFSPDGTKIVTASMDSTARVWDAETGKELLRLEHWGKVYSAAFSSDGTKIVTASRDATARVWDAETGKELLQLSHEGDVKSAVFSPDGTKIVTASWDKTARVWDATTGKDLLRLENNLIAGWFNSAVFSPDDTKIVTASWDETARVWDAETGKELLQLSHEGDVKSAVFSPDGTKIVTASWDKTARVWDAFTGKELLRLKKSFVNPVAFSSDGTQILITGEDDIVRIWNIDIQSLIDRGHKILNGYQLPSEDRRKYYLE